MINAEHDFTSNLLNAVGYNDNAMVKDILADELARLIVNEKRHIVSLLRRHNVNATINMNLKKIRSLVTNEIGRGNKAFTNEISEMIIRSQYDHKNAKETIENNIKRFNNKKYKAEGDKEEETFWQKLNNILKDEKVQELTSSLLSSGLEKLYEKDNPDLEKNETILDERLTVNELNNKKKLSTGAKVGIGVGVAGVAALIVFLIQRSVKNKNVKDEPSYN